MSKQPRRTPRDYAIEFGGYLATSAERYMATVNVYWAAYSDGDDEAVDEAEAAMSEAYQRLQSDIYEFRKRAGRVTRPPPVAVLPRPIGGISLNPAPQVDPFDPHNDGSGYEGKE